MRIRPVKESDAESICRINSSVVEGRVMNIANQHFADPATLVSGLTMFDHILVLETETGPHEICAAVHVEVDPQIFLRRMATLRIIVDPKWQGQGLGKILMKTALDMADNELMMERVEVEIPTNNVNALKLCKSTGFKVEGIAKDWMQTPDGKYVDAYLMAHCRHAK